MVSSGHGLSDANVGQPTTSHGFKAELLVKCSHLSIGVGHNPSCSALNGKPAGQLRRRRAFCLRTQRPRGGGVVDEVLSDCPQKSSLMFSDRVLYFCTFFETRVEYDSV